MAFPGPKLYRLPVAVARPMQGYVYQRRTDRVFRPSRFMGDAMAIDRSAIVSLRQHPIGTSPARTAKA